MHGPVVGIVGMGVVGRAAARLFAPDVATHDIADPDSASRDEINGCDLAFVCVPTPPGADGACDSSAVEEVVDWLAAPRIVIRSTVPPGTTDRLRARTGKAIVFQPEYLGETPAHPCAGAGPPPFIVLGGPISETSPVADFYKPRVGAATRFHFCDARTAELAKYMENAFFATKVTFVNEFRRIAAALGVDYNRLREVWLADERISPDHTDAYPDAPGFSGKCLPKDLAAIIACAEAAGAEPALLKAVQKTNRTHRPRRRVAAR